MLRGEQIVLRNVRAADLDVLYPLVNTLETRGDFYPWYFESEPSYRERFDKTGFWEENEGLLVMVDEDGDIVGQINFFPINHYGSGYEIGYRLYDPSHHGKGYTTEAVSLLTPYLFAEKKINRLQMNIHPDNIGSKKVAERNGFSYESLMRGSWYHQGQYHDLEIWALLREDATYPGSL